MAQRTRECPVAMRSCARLRIADLLASSGTPARRAADVAPRFRRAEPEEARARPVGPGDLLGDRGQRSPGLPSPCEAVLEHEHVMARALPFAHEPRTGLERAGARWREVSGAVHRLTEFGEAPLHGRADPAKGLLLQLPRDPQLQDLAADP